MSEIFSYNTIKVTLNKATRSLKILLNRPEVEHAFNKEMLFELESVLAWSSNKVEINSIFISSTESPKQLFCVGFEPKDWTEQSEDKIKIAFNKLQKIVFSLMHLPQTVIVDLKKGSAGAGSEFACGADLRISNKNTMLTFSHLSEGIAPSSGGLSILTTIIGRAAAKNWIMGSKTILSNELVNKDFVYDLYDEKQRNEEIRSLLMEINQQAPVSRMQTKSAFLQMDLNGLHQNIEIEQKTSQACLLTQDWKEFGKKSEEVEFTSARAFSMAMKEINSANN